MSKCNIYQNNSESKSSCTSQIIWNEVVITGTMNCLRFFVLIRWQAEKILQGLDVKRKLREEQY